MEKFFVAKENSRFYKEYMDWRNNIEEVNTVVADFLNKHGIEGKEYSVFNRAIGIVPTAQDKEKFESQFTKLHHDNGLRFFNKNSTIGRDWKKISKDMMFKHRPNPSWYLTDCIGRSSSSMLYHNDKLYVSVTADKVGCTDSFEEIKGSEFHKILEEMEDD